MVYHVRVLEFNSRDAFVKAVKDADYVILYARTDLPVWRDFVCTIGDLNLILYKYDKYSVIVVDPNVKGSFLFWTKVPNIKYYIIDRINEDDKRGAVIPLKSNEDGDKLIEGVQ